MKYYIIVAVLSIGMLFSTPYLRGFIPEAVSLAGISIGGYLLYSNAYADVPTLDVISGGVGVESREHIESVQGEYNLKLVLVGDRGMFLSGVAVTISDRSGNIIITHDTDGPYLLAKLKPGKYTLSATFNGLIQTKHFTIKPSFLRTVYVRFAYVDETGDTHFKQDQ